MKFDEAVDNIKNVTELRRFASAHVVDHSNLDEDKLREALKKVKPQYLHLETVKNTVEKAFYEEKDLDRRVLSKIIISNILLEEVGFALPSDILEEKVVSFEKMMIDKSNESDTYTLAGSRNSEHYSNLELYKFVLGVAWEHRNTKSPDEANLLRRLRKRLKITEYEHRILETKLGKFPKSNNELHTRSEVSRVRLYLQSMGLLVGIKDDNRNTFDIIPEELAQIIREILGKEIRNEGYKLLLERKEIRKKIVLQKILSKNGYKDLSDDKVDSLKQKIIRRVSPSSALEIFTNEQLYNMCSELGIAVSGSKTERIKRIIEYFDKMQIKTGDNKDPRAVYYEHFVELAFRERELLRAKNLIEKDLQIEHYFEQATQYLFENKLNHNPLNQPGSNRPDGLISFKDMYLMWDNKSKEKPGLVNLKDHIKQFDGYMNNSDKPVPIFLVIAPDFTPESELLAFTYSAEKINRNIVLITAAELKAISEKWSSKNNKHRDEPFPLGLFGNSGRFNKKIIDQLI
ncbi:hypothetical protein J7L68_06070 [bacterium]|nr:hypothetical protein [bacterium]